MSQILEVTDPIKANASKQPQRNPDVPVSELFELFGRRGAKIRKQMEAVRTTRKHDKDQLSDKDMERLTIRLESADRHDEERQQIVAKATKTQRESFDRYKHHIFVQSWKPLSTRNAELLKDDEWFIADPKVLDEADPEYLCEMCRHVDFEVLFTQRELPGNSVPSMPTKINFYGLRKVFEEGNRCAFCGLLRRKFAESKLISRMESDDIEDGEFTINVIDQGPEYALRLEVELEDQPMGTSVERFVVQRLQRESQQPLAGTFVQQDRADMDKLKEWLHICEERHPVLKKTSPELDLQSLRVIDVLELRIREVAMPASYACLSYVWGKGSQMQYTTTTKGSLEEPGGLRLADLPQTIADTINVARALGIRYLWIDALCILQDDAEDKGRIISKMGPIYGGATLTIIASTNTDPQEGLPGVSLTHRTIAQDVIKMQGLTLATGLHDPRQPISDIEGSLWNSRAWTFQERALSTRSVYFTQSQMVFKCVHGAFMLEETNPTPDTAFRHSTIEDQAESDIMHLVWSHPSLGRFAHRGFTTRNAGATLMLSGEVDIEAFVKMNLQEQKEKAPVFDITVDAPRDFMGMLGDHASGMTPWDMYRRAVDDYTQRKLSFESDALNAFTGVEHLIRQGINTKFWHGLPSFAFEQALLWQAREPLQRRIQDGLRLFPSWSWTAWRGQVSYRGRGWKNSVLWEPASVVKWIVHDDPQYFIKQLRKMMGGQMDEEEEGPAQEPTLPRELDTNSLRHVDTIGEDGWSVDRDKEYNRHVYNHHAYPGLKFNYPVDLPGQEIIDLPNSDRMLVFLTHVVPIVPVEMDKFTFKMKIEDSFMQLGINDESRSANYRPPWQRIVYHQGYRAGFLTLNNEESIPLEGDECEYQLTAIMRGSLPHAPPPPPGWEPYWEMEPRICQGVLFEEEWRDPPIEHQIKPDETVEPSTRPQNEDGDPHWDTGRFHGLSVFDVYDVLLLKKEGNIISRRIGAGKINCCAFWSASPEPTYVTLL